MKLKSWLKKPFKINFWLVLITAILVVMFFLSLPATKIANKTIPDDITKNYLPDLLPGNEFTVFKTYTLQPPQEYHAQLSKYAKTLQQRLGSTQLLFDSYKVVLNKNDIVIKIPQTLNTENTRALLTDAGNLKVVISKSKINDIPKEEQLFHFINATNYESVDINRNDIKKIYIRRNNINTNSPSFKKAPLIFVFSFTKEGTQKIKKLHVTENFNKLLAIQLDNQILTSEAISLQSANAFEQKPTLNVRSLFGLENSPHIISIMQNNALPSSLNITATSFEPPLMSLNKSMILGLTYVGILFISLSIFMLYKKVIFSSLIIWVIGIGMYLTTIIVLIKLSHLTFGLEVFIVLLTSTTLLVILFISLIYALLLPKKSLRFTIWYHRTQLFTKLITYLLLFPGILLLISPNPFNHLGNIFVLSFLCLFLSIITIKILFQQLINK